VVCNAGTGVQYHPSTMDAASNRPSDPLKVKYKTCLRLARIPSTRVLDMAVWYLYWKQLTSGSDDHSVVVFYTVILP
jgi:hypothetical protein